MWVWLANVRPCSYSLIQSVYLYFMLSYKTLYYCFENSKVCFCTWQACFVPFMQCLLIGFTAQFTLIRRCEYNCLTNIIFCVFSSQNCIMQRWCIFVAHIRNHFFKTYPNAPLTSLRKCMHETVIEDDQGQKVKGLQVLKFLENVSDAEVKDYSTREKAKNTHFLRFLWLFHFDEM